MEHSLVQGLRSD